MVQNNLIQTALKFNKGCKTAPIQTNKGYVCPTCAEFLIGKTETTCLNCISKKYKCSSCDYCWCSLESLI